jgi:choice-of-anchor A domain-containing protein
MEEAARRQEPGIDRVEARETMSTASSAERRLCITTRASARKLVAAATLLALVAASFVQSAYPQMEHRNAMVHALQAAAPAAVVVPNPNCTLIVPKSALTAQGLATPYQLVATDPNAGPCNEANTAQSAFVEAAVFDPATSTISIYSPLVIDKGTAPAAPPVVPTLPRNAIVAIWIGFNGNNLTLTGAGATTLANAKCVNGVPGSIFSQVSYCNAPAFFAAANTAIAAGTLVIPALGTDSTGQPCPTVRSFFVVDQDQSDNVDTRYLATATGATAQYTKANVAALKGAVTITNPGDNRLLSVFIDPAIGCTPFKAPNLADPGTTVPAVALNELSARYRQATPVAMIPAGDPMAEVLGTFDVPKTNLYRQGVDQPVSASGFFVDTGRYCRQMLRVAPARFAAEQTLLANFPSIVPAAASNLFTFLAQRYVAAYQLLNCAALTGQPDPVSFTMDANGVVNSATINSAQLATTIAALAATAAADNLADSAANSLLSVEGTPSAAVCGTGNKLPGPAASNGVLIVGAGNFISSNTDSTGDVAVGGNVSLANYSVASGIAGAPAQPVNPASLVVGGALAANNGGVGSGQNGAIYFASVAPQLNGFTANGGVIAAAPIDFSAAATYYQTLATNLGALAANGTTTVCDGCVTFTGTNPTLNVFAVNAGALAAANTISISAPAGSAVVINVTGSAAAFQNGSVNETGVSPASVLWNFPAATSVNIVGSMDPQGSILAPLSPVMGGFGQATGTLIAASYSGNTHFADVPFVCTLPGT